KVGRLADAAGTLTVRRQLLSDQPEELYATAREFALLAVRAGQGRAALSPEEADAKKRYSALALDTLKEAFAKGFKDVDQVRKEPAFGILRGRPEFNALLKR